MSQVRFVGWNKGLNTVHLIKMIRERAKIPLNEAHAIVNCVLEGKTAILTFANDVDANSLAVEATKLGAIAEVVM